MQQIFNVPCSPYEYVCKGREYSVPHPPRCPHCKRHGTMSKHGFYERYYLGGGYCGKIPIRRYICKACHRTVSMLPGFCHKRFQYCPSVIFEGISQALAQGGGTSKAEEIMRRRYPDLHVQRQHLNFYRRRMRDNAQLLEQSVRCMHSSVALSVNRQDRMMMARAALLAITESGGFHAFWRKAYIEAGIAVLAYPKITVS